MATTMKIEIDTQEFRVLPPEGVVLSKRPTHVKSFCESKHQYKKFLG